MSPSSRLTDRSIYIAGGDALITRLSFDAATGTVVGSPEIIPVPGVPGVRGLSISPRRLAARVCRTRLEQSDLGAAGHGWTARRPDRRVR